MRNDRPFFTSLRDAPRKRLRSDRGETIRIVDEELGPARNVDVHMNILRAGSGPGPFHFHAEAENVYIVLDGAIEVRFADEIRRLGEGEALLIPPGVPHGTSNPGSDDARFIEIYAPAGLDFHVLEEIGEMEE